VNWAPDILSGPDDSRHGAPMVRLTRILKDFREAGTLSGLIALWRFLSPPRQSQEQSDAVFLTKA
jgi:hypothetical protein